MMHSQSKLSQMKSEFEELNTSMSAVEFFSSSVLPGASAELHRRAMGVRAWKAFAWLSKNDTVLMLLITVATVSPLEKLMFRFLQWQSDIAFLSEDVTSPLACMSTLKSPTRRTVDDLLLLMESGWITDVSEEDDVTLLELVQGCRH